MHLISSQIDAENIFPNVNISVTFGVILKTMTIFLCTHGREGAVYSITMGAILKFLKFQQKRIYQFGFQKDPIMTNYFFRYFKMAAIEIE